MSCENKMESENMSPFHHYLQVGELSSMALCPRNHFLSDLQPSQLFHGNFFGIIPQMFHIISSKS